MYGGHRNRLGLEKSPYLLQHADNPVDWYPWGEEAFEKAERENKPVFLSIGYSACHWCHVMEYESFEDPVVGKLMNDAFVSIKVDREERPDIDMVYMSVCQIMTGSGGWPLNVILTPDKSPFFAATYIPRETRFGRVGLLDLIPGIREAWTKQQKEVRQAAGRIIQALQGSASGTSEGNLDASVLQEAFQHFSDNFDEEQGGFNEAPKFPLPHNLSFLLRYWKRSGDVRALDMVETTLQAMRRGGIYDQVGFGIHRYSTDSKWLVPHFEKMLYDQALLVIACLEAFQATGKEEYSRTAREVLDYVLRDMTAPGGGFYSAEDADSEGEEGKFYLWTVEEVREALSEEEADLALRVFGIIREGNFRAESGRLSGHNILHMTGPLEEIADRMGMPPSSLAEKLEIVRRQLWESREKRVHPLKDDKILTDWNGLMIAAMARAASVLNEVRYERPAREAADFILGRMRSDEGRLLHRFRGGQAALTANLDDYAFLVYGLLELYEAVFEVGYLKAAAALNLEMIEHFEDLSSGGFFFSADDSEKLLVRQKEIYDGAIPSGNSVAMLNLLRLGRITGDTGLEERAAETGKAFQSAVNRMPSAHSQLLAALDFALGPSLEIVISGDGQEEGIRQMLDIIRSRFIPNKIVILRREGWRSELDRIAPWTGNLSALDGKPTAYVCRGFRCELPAASAGGLLQLIDGNRQDGGTG